MGNATINTIKIFAAAPANKSFKAGAMAIISIISTGTCTTCVGITTTHRGFYLVIGFNAACSVGVISKRLLSKSIDSEGKTSDVSVEGGFLGRVPPAAGFRISKIPAKNGVTPKLPSEVAQCL